MGISTLIPFYKTMAATFASNREWMRPGIILKATSLNLNLGILGVGLSTFSVDRTGNFTGPVTLSIVSGVPLHTVLGIVPLGLTTILPTALGTLTVGLGTVSGTYPILVKASAANVDDSYVTINLTVT